MTKASDNVFPRLLVSEGGSTTTPAAGNVTVYAKANGLLYQKDDAGTETLLASGASGAVGTDAIWDAAGDTVVGTGANTAVRRMNNPGATVAPAVTDDSGDGYAIGSRWFDTTADKEYVALDVTVGAAVWKETTAAAGAGGLTQSYVGYNTIGGTAVAASGYGYIAKQITLAADSFVASVDIYRTHTNNYATEYLAGIYDETAGHAGKVLSHEYKRTFTLNSVAQWVHHSVSIWLPAGNYWIVMWGDSFGNVYYDAGSDTSAGAPAQTLAPYSLWSSPVDSTRKFSMRATILT